MTRQEVLYKVIEIVNEFRLNDAPNTTENSQLTEDFGMNSLDLVEFAMNIESRLDIRFYDVEFFGFGFSIMSVKDVVDLVCKKLKIPTNGVQKTVEKPVVKPTQPQNPELKKLGKVSSKFPKSQIELSGDEVFVKKIAETKQIKR